MPEFDPIISSADRADANGGHALCWSVMLFPRMMQDARREARIASCFRLGREYYAVLAARPMTLEIDRGHARLYATQRPRPKI